MKKRLPRASEVVVVRANAIPGAALESQPGPTVFEATPERCYRPVLVCSRPKGHNGPCDPVEKK